MAASPSDRVFYYPDPSLFGLNAPSPQSHPHQSTAFSVTYPPAAPVVAGPRPAPLALDPALLALPGRAAAPTHTPVVATPTPASGPNAGPVPAPFAGAPRLSVVGVMFPGFPAGLVPPMEINGEDAAKYNELVAVAYNTTNAGLKSGKAYKSNQSVDDRRSRRLRSLKDMWAAAGGLPTPRGR